jgi:hypothetical protein
MQNSEKQKNYAFCIITNIYKPLSLKADGMKRT